MTFRIASWNINSVRLRINQVIRYLNEENIDVLCLQETKTINATFPRKNLEEAGYPYLHYEGIKSYNGVAIISRIPFKEVKIEHHCGYKDARHISAILENTSLNFSLKIHSIYIPAGGDIADPDLNEKFAHKLHFINSLTSFFSQKIEEKTLLLGDFNIAPFEHDVWSHKQLLEVVSHTPIEVEHLKKFQATQDWIDSARYFIPQDQKLYSWWSYRARDWQKSNRGRRLDHIWASPDLLPYLKKYKTFTHARSWEKPSDHVPILLEMEQTS